MIFRFLFLISCICLVDANASLSFEDAARRALYHSPKLRASNDEVGAQSGLELQSKLLPNPIFAYSVENVFGNKNWHDWNAAESRYEVAQLIELGGKRKYRASAAGYRLFASEAGYEAKKLLILNTVMKIFVETAGLQEQLKVASDQLEVAEEVYKVVAAKVEAGRVSLLQLNKADIARATARIELDKAIVDFEKAKERLAIVWGASCADFDFVLFPFYTLDDPAPFEYCLYDLNNNPELVQLAYEHLSAQYSLNLEKAEAIPDLTVTVGYKTQRDTGDKGLILGASLPINVFNRNEGNIQKATFEVQKTRELYRELQLALENKISAAHRDLERTHREAVQYESKVLKAAVQSFEFAQEGYREGKFEYLDMLDSQRTLFEVREKYIQALVNYHKSKADLLYPNSQELIP